MNVVFVHVGADTRVPEIMVKAALGFGYRVWQLTDDETPEIAGVHEVIRKPFCGYLMTYRLRHLAEFPESEFCSLDTDVVIRKPLQDVFDRHFDVALTRRYHKILDPLGNDVTVDMPYNTGVMFSRNARFWSKALSICEALCEEERKWYGDQLSVARAARYFDVLDLDCAEWNFTPSNANEVPEHVRAVHYKGERKKWMTALSM